jgi:UDP-N-acetylmuramate--alanine ligase
MKSRPAPMKRANRYTPSSFGHTRRIHLVGIGGSGMSGIAEVLLNLGYKVTGSDLAENDAVRRLRRLGARVFLGHQAGRVAGSDVVVTSTAVAAHNVEVAEARRLDVPIIPRAEMLAELMRLKYGVAVAGSHGKTTTTSMIAAVLEGGGLDPTIIVGGRVGSLHANARLGKGDLMVAEADESDGSFLRLKPTLAVVTNIDREHLDHYEDLDEIKDAFVAFLNRVPFYGTSFLCTDDPGVRSILPRLERRHISYGFGSDAEFSASDVRLDGLTGSYMAKRAGESLGRVSLRVPGRHNVLNSLAAIAVGRELDIPFTKIARALSRFTGVDRRFQVRGERGGVLVVDDYGHHPAEIEATLSAAREGLGRRLVVVFQPHRYTRTHALAMEFHRAFKDADTVIVTEIYPAGEAPIPGVDGRSLAEGIASGGHGSVHCEPDMQKIPAILERIARPGDLVLTLGAGSVWKVGVAYLGMAAAVKPSNGADGKAVNGKRPKTRRAKSLSRERQAAARRAKATRATGKRRTSRGGRR